MTRSRDWGPTWSNVCQSVRNSSTGTGANGLVLSTNGGGPLPYGFDSSITDAVEYERVTAQSASSIQPTTTNNNFTGPTRASSTW